MRKVISTLLVLVMVLSLTVPAFATGNTTATTEGVLDGGADIGVEAETEATGATEGVLDGGADIGVDADTEDAGDTIGAIENAPAETEPVPTARDNSSEVLNEANQNLTVYIIIVAVLAVASLVLVLIKMNKMKNEN